MLRFSRAFYAIGYMFYHLLTAIQIFILDLTALGIAFLAATFNTHKVTSDDVFQWSSWLVDIIPFEGKEMGANFVVYLKGSGTGILLHHSKLAYRLSSKIVHKVKHHKKGKAVYPWHQT